MKITCRLFEGHWLYRLHSKSLSISRCKIQKHEKRQQSLKLNDVRYNGTLNEYDCI